MGETGGEGTTAKEGTERIVCIDKSFAGEDVADKEIESDRWEYGEVEVRWFEERCCKCG